MIPRPYWKIGFQWWVWSKRPAVGFAKSEFLFPSLHLLVVKPWSRCLTFLDLEYSAINVSNSITAVELEKRIMELLSRLSEAQNELLYVNILGSVPSASHMFNYSSLAISRCQNQVPWKIGKVYSYEFLVSRIQWKTIRPGLNLCILYSGGGFFFKCQNESFTYSRTWWKWNEVCKNIKCLTYHFLALGKYIYIKKPCALCSVILCLYIIKDLFHHPR